MHIPKSQIPLIILVIFFIVLATWQVSHDIAKKQFMMENAQINRDSIAAIQKEFEVKNQEEIELAFGAGQQSMVTLAGNWFKKMCTTHETFKFADGSSEALFVCMETQHIDELRKRQSHNGANNINELDTVN